MRINCLDHIDKLIEVQVNYIDSLHLRTHKESKTQLLDERLFFFVVKLQYNKDHEHKAPQRTTSIAKER